MPEEIKQVLDRLVNGDKKPQRRKPVNRDMLDFAKNVLLEKWFPEIEFCPDVFQRDELDKFAMWVAAFAFNRTDPNMCDRPKQCLMLCGPCGRGKTMLAKLLHQKFMLPFFTADELDIFANNMEEAMYYDKVRILSNSADIVVDDIGAEPLRTKYGNSPEFPQLLQRIYESWKNGTRLIIATSNLALSQRGLEDFAQRYGVRVADRIAEMYMPVYLGGEKNYRTTPKNAF